jgi:hypothetical protein
MEDWRYYLVHTNGCLQGINGLFADILTDRKCSSVILMPPKIHEGRDCSVGFRITGATYRLGDWVWQREPTNARTVGIRTSILPWYIASLSRTTPHPSKID